VVSSTAEVPAQRMNLQPIFSLHSRPKIVDGKPVVEFLIKKDGVFDHVMTQGEIDDFNRQFREAVLKFWQIPAGQLCEWGKV
jgi:hypothetical protein